MSAVLALATPSSASAAYTTQIDWCGTATTPACDPSRTFNQGMPRAEFIAAASQTCTSGVLAGMVGPGRVSTGKGGYLNMPTGFYNAFASTSVRYVLSDPIWCSNWGSGANVGQLAVPIRHYTHGLSEWEVGPDSFRFPNAITSDPAPYTALTLKCLTAAGAAWSATSTYSAGTSVGSQSGRTTWSGFTNQGGVQYMGGIYGSGGSTVMEQALRGTTSNCATVLAIDVTVIYGKLTGERTTHQWSAGLAAQGTPRTWDDSTAEQLDCSKPPPAVLPVECVDNPSAPYQIACGKLNALDASTWGNLGPCIFGTPADYSRAITMLTPSMGNLPFPGTGSCSPWYLGSILGSPFTIDICGWYPANRWMIDVVATAALWMGVVATIFRIRSGADA